MDKLLSQFCEPFFSALSPYEKELSCAREIRIRVSHPLLIRSKTEHTIPALLPTSAQLTDLMLAFCGQALYAHEDQLRQGFLTLPFGHRVGICGHMVRREGQLPHLAHIQSMNIRIARQLSCDRRAIDAVYSSGFLRSSLIISPPGMGKTTMLREMARILSAHGIQVALADERGELAACVQSVPQLDVGAHTDVMDGIPKAEAIGLMVRSMSPDVVICDEIGCESDADALIDARRCGVSVLCSAHSATFRDAVSRPALRRLLQGGVFDRVLLLGREAGRLAAVYDGEGRPC